jgi:tetratricopeptide (TPR) repeat protein
LIAAYPQFAAPHVNLALLHRKAGRLDEAEAELERAVERNPGNAVAWNELGLTRRMRGEFGEAAQAYERAIAADDRNAAAHRNFGVLLDLYLGDPERALVELERYKELSGEDRPVSGWIAELRQRTGKPAAPKKQAPAPEPSQEGAAPAEPASDASEPTAPVQEGAPPANPSPPDAADAAVPEKAGSGGSR